MKKLLGQSTLEYAVLIVIIASALLATQVYIKRGIQGRLRQSADDLGDQFSPGASIMTTVTNSGGTTLETVSGGVTTSTMQGPDITTRTVNLDIEGFASNNEYWAPFKT